MNTNAKTVTDTPSSAVSAKNKPEVTAPSAASL